MFLDGAENPVFHETLAAQSGQGDRAQAGRADTEMSRKEGQSRSGAVGVQGHEENVCRIWRASWFSNRRSARSRNRAAPRGKRKGKFEQMGKGWISNLQDCGFIYFCFFSGLAVLFRKRNS